MQDSKRYKPEVKHESLGEDFFSYVEAAEFPSHTLRYRNDDVANKIGLSGMDEKQWIDYFGKFMPLPNNLQRPLALKYHGHQFRHYNPQIGDGRGFLYAQLNVDGRLMDLATKGSGQTPYSRSGDGRLTLKGGYREVLATQYLEALGVDTSKSFSLIETGEKLQRNDEPSPTRSAVLVRYSHSHIRFGSFQRLRYLAQTENIEKLARYVCSNYYKQIDSSLDMNTLSKELLNAVTVQSAKTCAQWITAGFVHGVLNTDNMNITGESFDYGPYRFLKKCDPDFTAAYFDETGLYAYGRQPSAVYWNLHQLAVCFDAFENEDEEFNKIIENFPKYFEKYMVESCLARLGLKSSGTFELDQELKEAFFELLMQEDILFEQCFFDFYACTPEKDRYLHSVQAESYKSKAAKKLIELMDQFSASTVNTHPYFSEKYPCTLSIEEIESIWTFIDEADDWSVFKSKLDDIRFMAEAYRGGHNA